MARRRGQVIAEIGRVDAIFRYPVKSMAGTRLDSAALSWHGIEGDRRFAFRRVNDRGNFPWLSASKVPALVCFAPRSHDGNGTPTHVRTPDGAELPILSDELAGEVGRRHGAPVQMMELRQGIFDEAAVSVITPDTISAIAEASGTTPDVRRFRPNIVLRLHTPGAWQEDRWVGGTLTFGDAHGARVHVTMRDERCAMVNLDPDSGASTADVLKAVVRLNDNNAGVYASVIRTGQVAVGQPVLFHAP